MVTVLCPSSPCRSSRPITAALPMPPVPLIVPCALVHEPCASADEGLVHFDLAGHFLEGAGLHRKSNTVEHEPCGLLCDAQVRWTS